MHDTRTDGHNLDNIIADALVRLHEHSDDGDAWHTLGQFLLRSNLPRAARSALATSLQLALQEKIASHYDPIFRQEMKLTVIADRLDFFSFLCRGQKVLHVGCSDYPLFNPATNLHLRLHPHCRELDGLDTDTAGIAQLSLLAPGNYFSDAGQVTGSYDLLLVPETIEHVDNIRLFLEGLSGIRFRQCLITAPNAFLPNDNGNHWTASGSYVEHVHPDHTCWFSPATLSACIRKFTGWRIDELLLLDNHSMVGCLCSQEDGTR